MLEGNDVSVNWLMRVPRIAAIIGVVIVGFTLPWVTAETPSMSAETMLTGAMHTAESGTATSRWWPPLAAVAVIAALGAGRYFVARGDRSQRQAIRWRNAISGLGLVAAVGVSFSARQQLMFGPDDRAYPGATVRLGSGAYAVAAIGLILAVVGTVGYLRALRHDPRPPAFDRPIPVWVERTVFGVCLAALVAVLATMPEMTFNVDGERVAHAGFDGVLVGTATLPEGGSAAEVFDGWSALSLVFIGLTLLLGITWARDQQRRQLRTVRMVGAAPWAATGAIVVVTSAIGFFAALRWGPDTDDVGIDFSTHVGAGVYAAALVGAVMIGVEAFIRSRSGARWMRPLPTDDLEPGREYSAQFYEAAQRFVTVSTEILDPFGDEAELVYRGRRVSSFRVSSQPIDLAAAAWVIADLRRTEPHIDSVAVRHDDAAVLDSLARSLPDGLLGAVAKWDLSEAEAEALLKVWNDACLRIVELSGWCQVDNLPEEVGEATLAANVVIDAASNVPDRPLIRQLGSLDTPGGTIASWAYTVPTAGDRGRVAAVTVALMVDRDEVLEPDEAHARIGRAGGTYRAEGFGSMTFDDWFATANYRRSAVPSTEFWTKTMLVNAWAGLEDTEFTPIDA